MRSRLGGSFGLLLLGSLGTLTETVEETAVDLLQVGHAASTGGSSALSLDRPVV